jgi:hypothetical protein
MTRGPPAAAAADNVVVIISEEPTAIDVDVDFNADGAKEKNVVPAVANAAEEVPEEVPEPEPEPGANAEDVAVMDEVNSALT